MIIQLCCQGHVKVMNVFVVTFYSTTLVGTLPLVGMGDELCCIVCFLGRS